jgi:hypothetical protein
MRLAPTQLALPRIELTEAEILADLLYPDAPPAVPERPEAAR